MATFTRPDARMLGLEAPRAAAELAQFLRAYPRLAGGPRGDGHHVLVLPGFVAGDLSTAGLRRVLAARGYHPHRWALGRNLGPSQQVIDGMSVRLEQLYRGRPVSLIGWSLGGSYARYLARKHPEQVRQVITLGSPFRLEAGRPPLPVPATAIYSRTDGIVPWQACLEHDGPTSGSVEVHGSHCGLGHNVEAVTVILELLAQPPGSWRLPRSPVEVTA